MKTQSKILLYFLLLLAMLAWGGSWPSGKVVAGLADAEVIVFWRFFLGFISYIPLMIILRPSLKLSVGSFCQVLAGAIFIALYNRLYFTGLRFGLAGAASVLVTTLNPIFTFILAAIMFRNKVKSREIIGIVSGLIGGSILLEIWRVSGESLFISGNIFFLGCSLSWAFLSVTSEKSKDSISPLVFSFYVNGLAAVIGAFSALKHNLLAPLGLGAGFWFNVLYLSVIALTFATTIYFYASVRLGSHRASSFIFLVPFSAVLISWIFLSEVPKSNTITGGIFGITAVLLINYRPQALDYLKNLTQSNHKNH
jgi:drug/metabolite transporter (DMT)-like permease